MIYLKGLVSLVVTTFMVLSILFVDFAYKTFSLRQRDVQTDAIVVLAGGRGRVEEGIRLYREGKGNLLFLIGVSPAVRKIDLFQERPGGRSGDHVFLEKVSRNTLENAIYARELILQHRVVSIKLITSRYHMKRATLLFRTMLPRDIAIFPYPVDSKNLKEQWWSHGGSFRLLFSEFYKYCMFRLMFLVASGEMLPINGN